MGCSNSRQLSVDSGKKKEETSMEARISGEYSFISNVRVPYVVCLVLVLV